MPRENTYAMPKKATMGRSIPSGGPGVIVWKAAFSTKARNSMKGRCSNNSTFKPTRTLRCPNKRSQQTTSKSASQITRKATLKSQKSMGTTNNKTKKKGAINMPKKKIIYRSFSSI